MKTTKRVKGIATVNLPYLKTRLVVTNRNATVKTNGTIEIYSETGECSYNGQTFKVWRTCRTGEWHYGMH